MECNIQRFLIDILNTFYTYLVYNDFDIVLALDFLHPHLADLGLVIAQHFRQRRPALAVLLQHIEAVIFAGVTKAGIFRDCTSLHFRRKQTRGRTPTICVDRVGL